MKKENKIKLGLPSRGLRDQTLKLFKLANYETKFSESLYHLKIDDPEIECILARTEEIASYIEKGIIDAGITQKARLLDQKVKAIEVTELNYGNNTWWNAKVVLAIPKDSKIKSLKGLEGKKILTRLPEITKNYLKSHKVKAKVELVSWPTEPKIPIFGDAVVEFTNTGEALKTHNLKVLDVLMETSPVLIINIKTWQNKWKREKIENLGILLKGARIGLEMVGLMLHVSSEKIEDVLKILPALKRPTVTRLKGQNWFSVFTVADEKETREIIPKLKKIGCTDIVELPLNKVVL